VPEGGVSVQLLEQVGVWASRHWGRNSACPQNHLLGDWQE